MRLSKTKSTSSVPEKPKQRQAPRSHTITVIERLERLGVDPITILALAAAGDTVSLQIQTRAEYEAQAEIIEINGVPTIVRRSGKMRALEILPMKDRVRAAAEIAAYIHPKKQALSHSNADGSNLSQPVAPQIIVTMPDNGRGAPRKP